MQQPHDHLFQATFGQRSNAAALLQRVLPSSATDGVAWESLREVSSTLLDRDLAAHRADLLFHARRHHDRDVLFLLEHKAQQDLHAAVQLFRYVALVWQRWLDRPHRSTPLPLVVPLLVHHDRRPWRAPRSLATLLRLRANERALAPSLPLHLLDLADHSEASLRACSLPGAATLCLLHLSLVRWMSPDEFVAAALRWADLYREAAATTGIASLQVFHSYAIWVTETPRQQLADCMARILGPEAGAHVMSTADKLIAEGKAAGRAEILVHLLRKRFGRAADEHATRLHGASIAELDRWALRLLDARTIDEVFASD